MRLCLASKSYVVSMVMQGVDMINEYGSRFLRWTIEKSIHVACKNILPPNDIWFWRYITRYNRYQSRMMSVLKWKQFISKKNVLSSTTIYIYIIGIHFKQDYFIEKYWIISPYQIVKNLILLDSTANIAFYPLGWSSKQLWDESPKAQSHRLHMLWMALCQSVDTRRHQYSAV